MPGFSKFLFSVKTVFAVVPIKEFLERSTREAW